MEKEENINYASFESKSNFKLPPGAVITKKSVSLTVEEIENGFIIRKSYDIDYENDAGENSYKHFTKKWYSKENPMDIDMSVTEEKSLADKID